MKLLFVAIKISEVFLYLVAGFISPGPKLEKKKWVEQGFQRRSSSEKLEG